MLGSHRLGASPTSRDKAARWLCVHGALARSTFKLKLVPRLRLYKDIGYKDDRKFIDVYACQKLS